MNKLNKKETILGAAKTASAFLILLILSVFNLNEYIFAAITFSILTGGLQGAAGTGLFMVLCFLTKQNQIQMSLLYGCFTGTIFAGYFSQDSARKNSITFSTATVIIAYTAAWIVAERSAESIPEYVIRAALTFITLLLWNSIRKFRKTEK